MKKIIAATLACTLIGAWGIAQAGDAAAGKAKSAVCAGCHGADGNSTNPEWPKLAGQHAGYLAKQLNDFKSGKRKNATMSAMAATLSDQDIQDLAAYYSSQTIKTGEADPYLVALGERLYRGGNTETGVAACMGCHGPAGSGNPAANFPALAGQHAKYVVNTLDNFKDEKRTNDPNGMMQMLTAKMSPKEIQAVASYVNGLYQ
jgi:cbb3-type cytochrome c oxidase subunit III